MTLFFIHGAGGTPDAFAAQRPAFPDAHAIVLPGRCGVAGMPATIAEFADAVLRECDGKAALLCGHSMGAAIALECALRAPGIISGLVLIGGGARLRVAPAVFQSLEADFASGARALAQRFFAVPTAERVDAATQAMLEVGPEQTLRDFHACDGFDAIDRLGSVSVPLLAVTGELDALTPPKYARVLADRVPDGTARILEGAGHFAMVECSGETNALLAQFVARVLR